MKKEMLSKVMKRAWQIKREDSRNIFSLCLKLAWKEVKEMKEESMIEKLQNAMPELQLSLSADERRIIVVIKKAVVSYAAFKNSIEMNSQYEKGEYNKDDKTIELKNITMRRPFKQGRTLEENIFAIKRTMIYNAVFSK